VQGRDRIEFEKSGGFSARHGKNCVLDPEAMLEELRTAGVSASA
jgi:hypothetical protein